MWIFSGNETGSVLGLFVEHQEAAAVTKHDCFSGWLTPPGSRFQVYHLALSTRVRNQIRPPPPKKWETVWTQSCQPDIFIHGGVKKSPHQELYCKLEQRRHFITATFKDCYLILKKKKERKRLNLHYDPNSWNERQHNVLVDQCSLDFDETKWAHHAI